MHLQPSKDLASIEVGETDTIALQKECLMRSECEMPELLHKTTQCSWTELRQREQSVRIDLNVRKSSSVSCKSQNKV